MQYFNKVKSTNNTLIRYDYMEKFMEIFKVYLAFVNFVDLVCPNSSRLVWTREEFSQNERDMHSLFNQILDLIKQKNNREFRKFTRINVSTFERLLRVLKPKLVKYSQRKPIPPECRLLITLIYLAFDTPRPLLSMAFRLGLSTLRKIILETCECISTELSQYFVTTMNDEDYYELSDAYMEATGLPNCVGGFDALQFLTERKTRDPIVMLASCNTKYQIINVDVGLIHEVVENDNFVKNLIQNNLPSLPADMQMPDTGIVLASYVVTPSTFPLIKHTMRPYPGKMLRPDKSNFNERLKKCSDYLDNSFGVLLYKWKVLQNKFTCLPETACHIVQSCVILHNYAIEHDRSYFYKELVDNFDPDTQQYKNGVWRETLTLPKSNLYENFQQNSDDVGFVNRDLLKDYLYRENM
ncbi:putative nuclease HARBI1 [Stomoxys calcitrans]|uniref:DDE Tnp4 domain-containing protein n=1 Tax=Stomoxys calcitrans TaxID=35570 RepID=A0A1I8PN81_STOCA|nr:putative nuclease HARBI1 [Stomoxys calcitrans]